MTAVKVKMAELGVKSKDIIAAINNSRTLRCTAAEFSLAVNGVTHRDKDERILQYAAAVLRNIELESERKKR